MKKELSPLAILALLFVSIACSPLELAKIPVTGGVSRISCSSAEIAGMINLSGSSTNLTFGVMYSTNPGFSSAVQRPAKTYANNSFTVNTDVLEPETTYYYRSYISQNDDIAFGDTKSFTTLPISSMIKTWDATDIEPTTATLCGLLDLTDCRYETMEYGFRLTPEGGETITLKANNLSDMVFSVKAEGLNQGKKHEVTAYVILDGRIYEADKRTFSTQALQVNVVLSDATEITEFKTTISGELIVESQSSFTKTATLYYSSSPATTANGLKAWGTAMSLTLTGADGLFSETLTDLVPGTTYKYVVIATVGGVEYTSEVKFFTTATFSVNISTGEASNVKHTTASLNGELTVSSIEPLNTVVWFFISETAATVDALTMSGIEISSNLLGSAFSTGVAGMKDVTTYYYVACAKVHDKVFYGDVKALTTKEFPKPEVVDMGLSVKWASFNVGGETPEDYGYYYGWGETETKREFVWDLYTLCNGSSSTMNKYCTLSSYGIVDNKTILEPEDDVAHIKLSGMWRMPKREEWAELLNSNNCTWTWTIQNGVNGMLVTSKKTGNSIFLPAAGEYYMAFLYDLKSAGKYWSSSLGGENKAAFLFFSSNDTRMSSVGERFYGRTVRAVCD